MTDNPFPPVPRNLEHKALLDNVLVRRVLLDQRHSDLKEVYELDTARKTRAALAVGMAAVEYVDALEKLVAFYEHGETLP